MLSSSFYVWYVVLFQYVVCRRLSVISSRWQAAVVKHRVNKDRSFVFCNHDLRGDICAFLQFLGDWFIHVVEQFYQLLYTRQTLIFQINHAQVLCHQQQHRPRMSWYFTANVARHWLCQMEIKLQQEEGENIYKDKCIFW